MTEEHPGVAKKATTSSWTSKTKARPESKSTNRRTGERPVAITESTAAMIATEPTPAEKSRLALAEAEATHAEALTLRDDRQTAAEELRAHLTSGGASLADLDTYAEQFARALAAEQVAALLVEGWEVNVKGAEHALINDDTSLADALSDVVTDLYAGRLPVRVVTLSTEVEPNDNGDPVLFILQEKAGKNTGGILSGSLTLTLFRPPLFAVLDGPGIEEACRERGYSLDVWTGYSTDQGSHLQDTATVSVKRAWLPVPVLDRDPADVDFDAFTNALRDTLRNAVTAPWRAPRLYETGEENEGRAWAQTVSHEVFGRTKSGSERRIMVEVVTNVWRDIESEGVPVPLLREAVSSMVGNVTDNVGRIVAVEHCQVDVPDLLAPSADTKPFGVTARFALTYRID